MHRQTLFKSPEDALQAKLSAALAFTLNICILGTDNRLDDYIKTGGWNHFQRYRYNIRGRYINSKQQSTDSIDRIVNSTLTPNTRAMKYRQNQSSWFYRPDDYADGLSAIFVLPRDSNVNPVEDVQFNLHPNIKVMLFTTAITTAKRLGNCRERADLIMKYLWENPAGIFSIEVVSTKTFDHCFVIVNRKGNLHQPGTWGNAWIIDAWYETGNKKGLIMPGREFDRYITTIKTYAIKQAKQLARIGRHAGHIKPEPETLNRTEYMINPKLDRYPTYSTNPFRPIESYYFLMNEYTSDIHLDASRQPLILSYFQAHQNRFKPCLQAINENGANDILANRDDINANLRPI